MNGFALALRQVRYENTAFLAQPRIGVLHLCLPADVPRDIQPAVRQLGDGLPWRDRQPVYFLRAGHCSLLGDQRLLQQCGDRDVVL